jgi:hypothetical protein
VSPSTIIVGALIVGFVFYVTARGELPKYLSIFYGPVTPGQPITGPSSAGSAGVAGALGTAGAALQSTDNGINQDFSGGVTGNGVGQDFSGGVTGLTVPDVGTGGLY